MKNRFLIITLLFAAQFFGFAQMIKSVHPVKNDLHLIKSSHYSDSLNLSKIKGHSIKDLELPKIEKDGEFIAHEGFSLLYDENHEQAKWVAYELTKAETNQVFKRTNKFIPDPMVTTGSATKEDYARSGYDRGHLAPAADMEWSFNTVTESFYYSNMSPQLPGFNRGIWKKLEEQVRDWAINEESVYIVTGPVLSKGLPAIGPDEVSVPEYYYKVILEYNSKGVKGIGFVLPNTSSAEPLQSYAVSIDEVEQQTGIDFFPLLEDEQEKLIEKTVCLSCWGLR